MANTYTLISSVTVGAGGASSIDFTSIPATYTDLLVKLSVRQNTGNINYGYVRINGASTNLSYRSLEGSGSAAASANGAVGSYGIVNSSAYTANTFSNIEVYFPNYAGSTNKSWSADSVTENNATAAYADLIAGLWSQTAAINQLTFYPEAASSFVQYSTAYLYGISNS